MSGSNFKVNCQYLIIAKTLSVHHISAMLALKPDHFFNKGDNYVLQHSSAVSNKAILERPHTQWAISSKESIHPQLSLYSHLEYFEAVLSNKLGVLDSLKENYSCERTFWIWVEADTPTSLISLTSKDLSFFNRIADDLVIQTKVR